MKRLSRFLVRLYPQAWRARYGNEYAALLEQMPFRWRDVGNALWGALRMQSQSVAIRTVMVPSALAGLLMAAVLAWALPNTYSSVSVLRLNFLSGAHVSENDRKMAAQAVQAIYTGPLLAQIIQQQNLYGDLRRHHSLDKAVEQIRREIQVNFRQEQR